MAYSEQQGYARQLFYALSLRKLVLHMLWATFDKEIIIKRSMTDDVGDFRQVWFSVIQLHSTSCGATALTKGRLHCSVTKKTHHVYKLFALSRHAFKDLNTNHKIMGGQSV